MTATVSPTAAEQGSKPTSYPIGKITMEAIIKTRWRELAGLSFFQPSVMPMNPSEGDAEALASDVLAIERKFIPLLRDYADYGAETLTIPRDDMLEQVSIIIDALSELRGLIAGSRRD